MQCYNGGFLCSIRQVADSPSSAAKTEVRRSQSADIYSDDPDAGCTGAISQLPWAHLLTVGWQHTGRTEAGEGRDLVLQCTNCKLSS